jgi:signal peptidase I
LYINGQIPTDPRFQRVMSGTFRTPAPPGYKGYSNTVGNLLNSLEATVTLDEGQYFALGDNSYFSSDSRDWGPVPEKNFMGTGPLRLLALLPR